MIQWNVGGKDVATHKNPDLDKEQNTSYHTAISQGQVTSTCTKIGWEKGENKRATYNNINSNNNNNNHYYYLEVKKGMGKTWNIYGEH